MANFNTESDCNCSQNMPQQQASAGQCQMAADTSQARPMPCKANMEYHKTNSGSCKGNMEHHRAASMPRQASMNQRQMANWQRQSGMNQRPTPAAHGHTSMDSGQMRMQKQMNTRPAMPRPCPGDTDALAGMPIAMAYVPWQFFHDTYEPDKALQYGTIFPELNKPFYGKGGCPK